MDGSISHERWERIGAELLPAVEEVKRSSCQGRQCQYVCEWGEIILVHPIVHRICAIALSD